MMAAWIHHIEKKNKRRWPLAIFAFLLAFSLFDVESLHAVRGRPSYEDDKSVVMREILDNLDTMRHEVNNHESEIRMFDEKFANQEEILDSLRRQVSDALQAVRENLKSHSNQLEAKLAGHDNASKGLSSELKSYTNEYSNALSDYKRRIGELEKLIEIQNHNIENLQAAMNAIMEVVQGKETSVEKISSSLEAGSSKIYRVKAGDTLEKIAKQNQTTIKKLKDANSLTSDIVKVGQKLKLPE